MGGPCHIGHNMALKASGSFNSVSTFDIEELMIDNYYYFDKSTKQRSSLPEYCDFCDVECRKILKHASTKWLSLELVVDQILRQCPALRSYFLSEGDTNAWFQRVQQVRSSLMSEVYAMCCHASLQLVVNSTKFLQCEDPIMPLISDQRKNNDQVF